jgi:hypothetical protein
LVVQASLCQFAISHSYIIVTYLFMVVTTSML